MTAHSSLLMPLSTQLLSHLLSYSTSSCLTRVLCCQSSTSWWPASTTDSTKPFLTGWQNISLLWDQHLWTRTLKEHWSSLFDSLSQEQSSMVAGFIMQRQFCEQFMVQVSNCVYFFVQLVTYFDWLVTNVTYFIDSSQMLRISIDSSQFQHLFCLHSFRVQPWSPVQ